jgi:S-(hydroxymethyl)glutathione dehydrogenase/alcohol dehydrogenase
MEDAMKAAVLKAAKTPMTIEDVRLDKPGPHEVRVRLAASGLCHSDYHVIAGDLPSRFPAILGHEAAGVVEEVGGRVRGLKPGDHVVACVSSFCGHCKPCVQGFTHRCADKPVRGRNDPPSHMLGDTPVLVRTLAAFAEEILVHENALARVPRELPLDRACILGCALVTGVGAVTRRAKVEPGSTVAVIGCGGVGLSVIQGARLAGAARIIAVDLSPARLAQAKKFGATDTVPGGDDAAKAVVELTAGGVDHAFEVIGLAKTMEQGVRMLAAGGTLTIVGVPAQGSQLTLSNPGALLFKEARVQWSLMGSSPFTVDIPRLADLYLRGKLELDAMVSRRLALSEIDSGFESMLSGEGARNVVVFEDVLKEAARAA